MGQASSTSNTPESYVYTLTAAGPGCTGGFAASGTITINPYTSGVPVGDPNPVYCDNTFANAGRQTITYFAPNAVTISIVTPTLQPSWVTAAKVGNNIEIYVDVPNLAITAPVTYPYAYNLVGNAFGCVATPSPISGVITISPEDIITFAGSVGDDAQIICVGNTPSPTFAFNPIEYQLSGGATTISSITYTQDGGPVQEGLPPGFWL